MTKPSPSATTRSVPAQSPEKLLEVAQDHIRPLIGVIDQLNEADAEDEPKGYQQTAHTAVFQGSHSAAISSLKSRSARRSTGRAAPRVRSV
jgi:hypothetical protein